MSKKLQLLAVLICLIFTQALAQKKIGNETDAQKNKRMEWWQDGRFGMFIHFGLYSGAARA